MNRAKRTAQVQELRAELGKWQASIRAHLGEWQQANTNAHRYMLRAERGEWEALAGGWVTWRKTIEPWQDGKQGKFDIVKHNVEMAEYYQQRAHGMAATMARDAKVVEDLRARIARLERPTVWEWLRELLWPLDIYLACRLAKSGKRA